MPAILHQEWLNRNAYRAYPIREDSQRHPTVGGQVVSTLQLPNDLLVDFVMTVAAWEDISVHLYQVAITSNTITLTFRDDQDTTIAVFSIDRAAHAANQAYNFVGQDTYEDARGRIVLGDLSRLSDALPDGIYEFDADQTPMEATTVRPDIRGVRSLRTVSDGSESEYIHGHIKLLAGYNVRLTYIVEHNAIRIDAINGAGFNDTCECEEAAGGDGNPQNNIVRTINGVPIEDVEIVGDGECVEVETSGNRITVTDKCSKPCCSCPELEFLTQSLRVMESSMTRLEEYAQQLEQRISVFVSNYVMTFQI